MLRVRRVRRYRKARYPRGLARARRRKTSGAAAGGLSALILMALTEACEAGGGVGITGPPPVMPEMVTETEARQIIRQVFTENGVQLQEDVPLVFRWAADSLAFDVDGYNTEMEVGFEYVDDAERGTFSAGFKAAMAEAAAEDGPHIKIFETAVKTDGTEAEMEAQTQAFIDALRAQGII